VLLDRLGREAAAGLLLLKTLATITLLFVKCVSPSFCCAGYPASLKHGWVMSMPVSTMATLTSAPAVAEEPPLAAQACGAEINARSGSSTVG